MCCSDFRMHVDMPFRLYTCGTARAFVRQIAPARWKCECRNMHMTCCSMTCGEEGNRSVLFVSPVWPEASSSAAGVRSTGLIESFQSHGDNVSYVSISNPNEHSKKLQECGVSVFTCSPNREEAFVKVLNSAEPDIVVFDRFFAEEMFSFMVHMHRPGAMRVLDMQDVHFIRRGREKMAKHGAATESILQHRPTAAFEPCLRELASIHRSDLTLVCSPVELRILENHYGIPRKKMVEASFFPSPSPYALGDASLPGYAQREHAMMIGNFKHPPNADSVMWACVHLWPKIRRSSDSKPELHVYGAYSSGKFEQLHDPVRRLVNGTSLR